MLLLYWHNLPPAEDTKDDFKDEFLLGLLILQGCPYDHCVMHTSYQISDY